MMERRLTERLKTYWHQLGGGKLPSYRSLNPERVADLWPNCMSLEVLNAQSRSLMYSYYYVGDALKKIYGRDLTGQLNSSAMRDIPGWQLIKKLDEVIADPRVEEEQGQFINAQNKVVKYRACLLPFGADGVVTHMLIGMSYREF